jgi:nitroreductase
LSMRPRRPLFATDVILPAVQSYRSSLLAASGKMTSELVWAHDVMQVYFDTVSSHPVVAEAHEIFASANKMLFVPECAKPVEQRSRTTPFPYAEGAALSVSYEDMLQLAQRRRSVRWFKDTPVQDEIIDQAIKIASLSPSACNRQPYRFVVVREPVNLNLVRELPMGVAGFADNLPVMVAIVGRLRAYSNSRDRHLIYIDGGLAAMSFMFALETLGLSSCPINWPDIKWREQQATKLMMLDPDERIVMWVGVGYADEEGLVPASTKLDVEQIRTFL